MTGSVCLRRHELALLPSRSAAGQASVSGSPPDFTKRVAGDCSINGLRLAEHMVEKSSTTPARLWPGTRRRPHSG
jgi:hypothetical protein